MQNKRYVNQPIHAYIIPSGDSHQSEYIASCDQRRAFISGFTGSSGTAVVTRKEAALWTDGRYFIQASQEMDHNWTLMKQGLPETPSEGKWLNKTLEISSIVGADPHLIEEEVWKELTRELQTEGHSLVPITHNLIDVLWAGGRPQRPANLVLPLEIKYTGCSTQEKLIRLRENLQEENVFMIVLTALDEVAYLYNLRGVRHRIQPCILSLNNNTGKVWISNHSSHAVTQLVPRERRLTKLSPVALMKAVKNEVEIKGMEACHIRDATALCRYFAWLEKEASKGTQTEISAAEQLISIDKSWMSL
ncbi:hypothetical protein Pcinc_038976 [Petrolisthes cinctipes]|uniref:Creatinase N-terminal domain-containing protein n=1 Tax=Petrolisthes cinctipes TaxID=88211 RepID=A0AAE1BQR2_PETCI|nr:hypothetical protein Pcinc_038976 [Petrolisthes cinctipes]